VGEVTQNGKKEKIIILGCDVAPATRLTNINYPVTHTASDGTMGCKTFEFRHEDKGAGSGGVYANLDLGMNGQTCSCDHIDGCNSDYLKLEKTETVVADVPDPKKPKSGAADLASGLVSVALSWMIMARLF